MQHSKDSIHSFTVSTEEAGTRLDTLLHHHFPQYSRTYFQYLIEKGCILVNAKPFKKRDKPKTGDEIEICFLLTPEISLTPEQITLDILYEDDHLIAINKPAGMVVHPGPGHPSGTCVNALLYHCHHLPACRESIRPGIVHRLDKDTSGVLLAAKTTEMHQKMVTLFSRRHIQKNYLAITLGNPGEGLIAAPIGRNPTDRKEMSICFKKGRDAQSFCQVLWKNEQLALVDVALMTGRTHQIRVHLKHKGAPVLGDKVYGSVSGNKAHGAERQLLHAHRIAFIHPITSESLKLEAPIASDFLKFMKHFSMPIISH